MVIQGVQCAVILGTALHIFNAFYFFQYSFGLFFTEFVSSPNKLISSEHTDRCAAFS
jgi:hypothetical protein